VFSPVRVHVVIALGLAVVMLAGCGPKKADTPEDAVRMLLAALAAGDSKRAADLIAWEVLAKRENPDWDSIPRSQQTLIIHKEKDLNAAALQSFGARLQGGEIGQATIQGDGAQVSVRTQSGEIALEAAQTDAGWKIIMPVQL
jgi:hypothetical protein